MEPNWPFASLGRTFVVALTLFRTATSLLIHFAVLRFRSCPTDMTYVGKRLALLFEALGGGYLKIGQILSTRSDLLPEKLIRPLQCLHDSMSPFSAAEAQSIIERSLGLPLEVLFRTFDPSPIGSASIAQVHRAVLWNSETEVAVKVRRSGIAKTIRTDARTFLRFVRIASFLPYVRGIPLVEAVQEIVSSLIGQTSFLTEADHHRRFFALFDNDAQIRVPQLFENYCTDDVLVMEYFPDLIKINSPGLDDMNHRKAVVAGLRGLYKMLFVAGLVHCDLHPGNILVHPDEKVVVMDFGFSKVMLQSERKAFSELFLAVAFNDGTAAAKIVLETAQHVPLELDRAAFEQDMTELINQSSGTRASEFLIASFVNSLFRIQREHRVYGSPNFTLAILSLIVYEGIIRQRCANLDFQREAVPLLLVALEETA